jgi:hypothetical protein
MVFEDFLEDAEETPPWDDKNSGMKFSGQLLTFVDQDPPLGRGYRVQQFKQVINHMGGAQSSLPRCQRSSPWDPISETRGPAHEVTHI